MNTLLRLASSSGKLPMRNASYLKYISSTIVFTAVEKQMVRSTYRSFSSARETKLLKTGKGFGNVNLIFCHANIFFIKVSLEIAIGEMNKNI